MACVTEVVSLLLLQSGLGRGVQLLGNNSSNSSSASLTSDVCLIPPPPHHQQQQVVVSTNGMDHFLSGLEHGANTWYAAAAAPRAAAIHAAQSHEFAVGPSEYTTLLSS